jgi:hypothetical protein
LDKKEFLPKGTYAATIVSVGVEYPLAPVTNAHVLLRLTRRIEAPTVFSGRIVHQYLDIEHPHSAERIDRGREALRELAGVLDAPESGYDARDFRWLRHRPHLIEVDNGKVHGAFRLGGSGDAR